MVALPRVGFLLWFLRRSAFGRRTWTGVLWCALTVAAFAWLGLVLLSVAHGLGPVRMNELRSRPHARALWIGETRLEGILTPARLKKLAERLRERADMADALEAISPFYEPDLKWGKEDGSDTYPILRGRTFQAGDPLLADLGKQLAFGAIPTNPQAKGVVVTAALLGHLKVPAGQKALRLQLRSGETLAVSILGSLKEGVTLPGGHLYLLPEAYELELDTTIPNEPLVQLATNPIPAKAYALDGMPPPAKNKLQEAFSGLKLYFPPDEQLQGDQVVWILETKAAAVPPTVNQWRGYLQTINQVLEKERIAVVHEFEQIRLPLGLKPMPPNRPAFHRAALYLRDVQNFPAAIDECAAAGLPLDESSRRAAYTIREITAATAVYESMARWLLVLPACVIFFGLAFLQLLRSQQKTVELGVLKALGARDGQLLRLCLVEATAVWGLGLVGGLALSAGTLAAVNTYWSLTPEGCFRVTAVSWAELAAIVCGSWLACYGSFWWGTRRARCSSPLLTLGAAR